MLGGRADLSYLKGIHNIKAGITYEDTILTENDAFGIVDPTFNPVCFNADGSPNTDPTLTDPNNCTGALQANPGYDPLLACIDLTRTGPLPGVYGCPSSTSGRYKFRGHADIRELACFSRTTSRSRTGPSTWACASITTTASPARIKWSRVWESRTTSSRPIRCLRISYARTLETPFNENLVLASNGCNDPVVNDLMAAIQGYPCLTGSAASRLAQRVSRRYSSRLSESTW